MTWYTVQCGFAGYHANTVTVEADTLEEALEKAIEVANQDPNWKSVDHCGPRSLTLAASAATGPVGPRHQSLPVPARFTEKGEPPVVTLTGPRPPGGVEVTGRRRPHPLRRSRRDRDHRGFRSAAAPRQQAGGHRPAEIRRSSRHRGPRRQGVVASRVGKERQPCQILNPATPPHSLPCSPHMLRPRICCGAVASNRPRSEPSI